MNREALTTEPVEAGLSQNAQRPFPVSPAGAVAAARVRVQRGDLWTRGKAK